MFDEKKAKVVSNVINEQHKYLLQFGLAQVVLLPNVWKISSHFQPTKTQHKKIAFKSLLDTSSG